MRLVKRGLFVIVGLVLVLGGILVFNAARAGSGSAISVGEPAPPVALRPGAPERFAAALALPTISPEDEADRDHEAFLALHAHLAESYPRVHETLSLETVNELSLLYTWTGREPGAAPIVLMSHLDVVPVEPGTEGDWEQDPYGGTISDGFVWGRGALDDTLGVIGLLEAVEGLLADGFEPERTIYLAFGHDEEVGGNLGARKIAELLAERGVEPAWVMDEGGAVVAEGVPGTGGPAALIGIAEKGYINVALTAPAAGGHSSMPPEVTSIGRLSRAIARLESDQMEASLNPVVREMLAAVTPHSPFTTRLFLSNLWLFEGLVAGGMVGDTSSAAMVRTTTAPTIIDAGVKANVLPSSAKAVVNFRIAPGDTPESVLEHVRRTIDDPDIEVAVHGEKPNPASPVSPTDSDGYRTIRASIEKQFPDVIVVPFLLVGGTDSKWFTPLTPNVYRFLPYVFGPDDMTRFHGTNERASVAGFEKAIQFYAQLIRDGAGPATPAVLRDTD